MPVKCPAAVAGANWQAGVTRGNSRLRVMLDGEPVVAAFAASVKAEPQWVDVYELPDLRRGQRPYDAPDEADVVELALHAEIFGRPPGVRRLFGHVELVHARFE